MIHEYNIAEVEPDTRLLLRVAQEAGLRARSLTMTWKHLSRLGDAYPVLARLSNGNTIILTNYLQPAGEPARVGVIDPLLNRPGMLLITEQELANVWTGEIILLKRLYKLSDENQPFSLRWFLPEIIRQRGTLRDVAIAAILMQVLALGMPIFTQIIIDKVVAHQNYSTLYVVTLCIFVVVVFDSTFTFLRGYMLLRATSKVDARLSTRTYSHLLSLPLAFFERAPAGVLIKHMQQTEKIRQFLTGKVFFTALDAVALPVFLPVLMIYSLALTGVVLTFAGMIAIVIFLILGPFRRRLKELYEAEAIRQAMLVESIHGMRTVKAVALEPVQRRKWDQSVATAVTKTFGVGKISTAANAITTLFERLMTVSVIFVGTHLVFDDLMSVGALVAFMMLSNRVTSPLVQFATLVHEYQETTLSVQMLGNIMNAKPEQNVAGGLRPPIKGRIEFRDVTFRYPGSTLPALAQVSFEAREGSIIGIVGRSGSGKTTVTRLITGIQQCQEGLVRVDGHDLREIDLTHLRTSIGVVLQDNFLFRGTIRENIGLTKPDSTLEDISRVAKLAGADEFIEQLPYGVDTMVEENGSNFSGGQKQRLAIARALLNDPRILILDEATSALDPDSEAIVHNNLSAISKGRTVVVVSHRLSSLTACDKILVLERGRIVDQGRHTDLLGRCSIYQHLWAQQTRHLG